jgi:hypothetical protein
MITSTKELNRLTTTALTLGEQSRAKDPLLAGTCPLGLWTHLDAFDIANNEFVGIIPDVDVLSELMTFAVNGNNLTGTFPDALCFGERYQPGKYIVVETVADCVDENDVGSLDLVCPKGCCTECCDSEFGICYPQ